MEKAYDHVDGKFVDYMLLRFGFGESWRGWMRESNPTTSFSVPTNGYPSKFNASRAIQKGIHSPPFCLQ